MAGTCPQHWFAASCSRCSCRRRCSSAARACSCRCRSSASRRCRAYSASIAPLLSLFLPAGSLLRLPDLALPFQFLSLGLALAFFFLTTGTGFGLALLFGSTLLFLPQPLALILALAHGLVPGLGVHVRTRGPDQVPSAVALAGAEPDAPVPRADPMNDRLPVQYPADEGGQLQVVNGNPGPVLEAERGRPVDDGPRPVVARLLDPDRRYGAHPRRLPARADPAHADALGPVPLGAFLDVLVADR